MNLTQAWFEGNQAEYGGAIAIDPLYDGTLEVSGAYFAHNIASQNGGAIRFAKSERSPRVTVANTLMHDNHAGMGGGALHFSPLGKSSDLIFNNITVFQNTVEGEGAGIWFEEPISNGAFLNSVVLANESGAYKRANKSDFKDALITGVWQVNGSGPEYRYEFTQIDEDGLKQYELDQPLFDDNDEPWLRLENSLDYVGRKGNEWRTLEELLAEPSDVADKWFDAWSDALPNIGSALKISAAKDEQSFTVSKGGKTLFVLEQKEAQLPAEIIPGDGVDFLKCRF